MIRIQSRFAGLLPAYLALASLGSAGAAVKSERIDYRGWNGGYRLSNATVELVFVPQIGRIMRYGFIGGPNALWENPDLAGKVVNLANPPGDWTNFGGDKLWPAPQERWGWPPDPVIDASPQTVEEFRGGIRVRGAVSRKHGVRFSREIILDPAGAHVRIVNRMENASAEPVTWSIWEVAQANDPDYATMAKNAAFPGGFRPFPTSPPDPAMVEARGSEVRFRRSAKQGGKIGGPPSAAPLAARMGGLRFLVSAEFPRLPASAYPDSGCAQHIWSNPDPLRYMELEMLGPLRALKPGESSTLVTHWRLEQTKL